MWKSSLEVLKQKNVDLVFATSTPLTIGIPALVKKSFHRTKFIFEVRDLWPEVPIQMGGLKNPILIAIAKQLEKNIYKSAEHIIALSPGMADGVLKYESSEKVSMIPNMAKIDEFFPREHNHELLTALGLKANSFKLIHFGALGLANGVESIIDSAILLKDYPDIEFIFVGGGSREPYLKDLCQKYKLNNIHFLGKYPMNTLSEIVNFCDISLVSFMDLPILYTNSPNKLFDSLSAGKPIIVNSAGWTRNMILENECGFYVNPNHPEELKDLIISIKNDDALLDKLGRNSRKLAETTYDKSILCNKFADVISSTLLSIEKS
ncbi:glycosyltransferase family 4 protein [Croceiramulus getboli]|nr:glycosyltransferase family 4 protein [Flavobacteriaceae bacterium YJPT1-3]